MNKLLAVFTLAISSHAFANNLPRHGYVEKPASRAFLCSEQGGRLNKMCGSVQYEPQSIEGIKGFPDGGPSDGHIASGDNPQFDNLNEQSTNRWKKVELESGKQIFTWSLTAPHSTESWRYFITKQDWDPNKPLVRSDFELIPFCERFDTGKTPSDKVSMQCNIPEREGYQVILGVWDIADTGNAFYQVIDAFFTGEKNNENSETNEQMDRDFISKIEISKQQVESDQFITYHFKATSENKPYSKPIYKWFLPEKAKGIVTSEGDSSFLIEKENELQFYKAKVRVTAGKEEKVFITDINVPEVNHENTYDYIFPDNILYYTEETRVYQPANKHIYQCKPFPYSGFCKQWKPSARQYEPGVGSTWKTAWILIN